MKIKIVRIASLYFNDSTQKWWAEAKIFLINKNGFETFGAKSRIIQLNETKLPLLIKDSFSISTSRVIIRNPLGLYGHMIREWFLHLIEPKESHDSP